jgi:hypothetical protein
MQRKDAARDQRGDARPPPKDPARDQRRGEARERVQQDVAQVERPRRAAAHAQVPRVAQRDEGAVEGGAFEPEPRPAEVREGARPVDMERAAGVLVEQQAEEEVVAQEAAAQARDIGQDRDRERHEQRPARKAGRWGGGIQRLTHAGRMRGAGRRCQPACGPCSSWPGSRGRKRQSAPGVETALLRRNATPKRILI